MIVKTNGFELFIDSTKVSPEIMDSIKQDGGDIYPYEQVTERLEYLVKIIYNVLKTYYLESVESMN